MTPIQPECQDYDERDGDDRHQTHDHGGILDVLWQGLLALFAWRCSFWPNDWSRIQVRQAVAIRFNTAAEDHTFGRLALRRFT